MHCHQKRCVFSGQARDLTFEQCVSHCCTSINCAAFAWYKFATPHSNPFSAAELQAGAAQAAEAAAPAQFVELPPFDWGAPPSLGMTHEASEALCQARCASKPGCNVGLFLGPQLRPATQKGTRVLISLWDSLMFGRVHEYPPEH